MDFSVPVEVYIKEGLIFDEVGFECFSCLSSICILLYSIIRSVKQSKAKPEYHIIIIIIKWILKRKLQRFM